MEPQFLNSHEVAKINFRMIRKFGGSFGLRDEGLLDSALARPRSGFAGYEAYPTLFLKAASLIHSLIKNHPFVDGNKRTAVVACALFLKRNGFSIETSQESLVKFALDIATDKLDEKEIANWLEVNSRTV